MFLHDTISCWTSQIKNLLFRIIQNIITSGFLSVFIHNLLIETKFYFFNNYFSCCRQNPSNLLYSYSFVKVHKWRRIVVVFVNSIKTVNIKCSLHNEGVYVIYTTHFYLIPPSLLTSMSFTHIAERYCKHVIEENIAILWT